MSNMTLSKITMKDLGHGVNILDIEVPEALDCTVKCGIDFLDDAVGGEGFTPSSVMLFTGTPGAGKTTLMLKMADNITAAGHICLVNNAEESPLQVRKTVKRLKCTNGFFIGQDSKVSEIIMHAKILKKKNPKKQLFLVVDSLAAVDDGFFENGYTNSMTAVRATELLCDFAKETFAVVIIVGHVTKGNVFAGRQTIKHAVDIHMHLGIDDDKKSETLGMRLLEVSKNRFGCNQRSYVLDMQSDGLREVGSFCKSDPQS